MVCFVIVLQIQKTHFVFPSCSMRQHNLLKYEIKFIIIFIPFVVPIYIVRSSSSQRLALSYATFGSSEPLNRVSCLLSYKKSNIHHSYPSEIRCDYVSHGTSIRCDRLRQSGHIISQHISYFNKLWQSPTQLVASSHNFEKSRNEKHHCGSHRRNWWRAAIIFKCQETKSIITLTRHRSMSSNLETRTSTAIHKNGSVMRSTSLTLHPSRLSTQSFTIQQFEKSYQFLPSNQVVRCQYAPGAAEPQFQNHRVSGSQNR